MSELMLITIKLRLRDKHSSALNRQAQSVNFVWNYCNDLQRRSVRDDRPWTNAPLLMRMTAGSSKDLGLHAHTVQGVCKRYDQSRRAGKAARLKWRSRKSLGWVPFNTGHVRFDGEAFVFNGQRYETMHSRSELIVGQRFLAGSFNADARGHWYINLTTEVATAEPDFSSAIGIDLGLKTLATLSDGGAIHMPRFYRHSEAALASAQRARKGKRAKAIHAKARNRRKDFLHKASNALVREHGTIIVGDVSPSRLAKTRMAKSIYDAGWAGFKHMLSYKAIRHGGRYLEASEAYSTQTCSDCGSISGPRGLKGLAIREWTCGDCGASHDRDVNGALNILRVGLDTLAEGARA